MHKNPPQAAVRLQESSLSLIGVAVGVGVGVYFTLRSPHNITGCVSTVDGGLQLNDEKAMNTYRLEGDIAGIKPSERVRLSGKPARDKNKQNIFTVSKVSKSYGSCNLHRAVP